MTNFDSFFGDAMHVRSEKLLMFVRSLDVEKVHEAKKQRRRSSFVLNVEWEEKERS